MKCSASRFLPPNCAFPAEIGCCGKFAAATIRPECKSISGRRQPRRILGKILPAGMVVAPHRLADGASSRFPALNTPEFGAGAQAIRAAIRSAFVSWNASRPQGLTCRFSLLASTAQSAGGFGAVACDGVVGHRIVTHALRVAGRRATAAATENQHRNTGRGLSFGEMPKSASSRVGVSALCNAMMAGICAPVTGI